MERIQASLMAEGKKKKRFIYLGDGNGDYCPSLKLGEGDFLLPRKNFPLWDLISQNPLVIKAEIHEWSDGEEMGRILLSLINTISMAENAQLFLSPQNMAVPVREALASPTPSSAMVANWIQIHHPCSSTVQQSKHNLSTSIICMEDEDIKFW